MPRKVVRLRPPARSRDTGRSKTPAARAREADQIGKRLIFDRETWRAIDVLARDQMKDLQELTEEAFRDLLKKHGRTADFREALRLSALQKEQSKKEESKSRSKQKTKGRRR